MRAGQPGVGRMLDWKHAVRDVPHVRSPSVHSGAYMRQSNKVIVRALEPEGCDLDRQGDDKAM